MSIIDKTLERITIQEYLKKNRLFEGAFIAYPDPPDCIFQKDDIRGWIEVTCYYGYFKKFTRTENQKKPYGAYEYQCPINDHDYVNDVIQGIKKQIAIKDSRENYKNFSNSFGPGILIIFINDACFNWQVHLQKTIDPESYKSLRLNNFEAVYVYNYPVITEQIAPYVMQWKSKVLENYENFYLILKK